MPSALLSPTDLENLFPEGIFILQQYTLEFFSFFRSFFFRVSHFLKNPAFIIAHTLVSLRLFYEMKAKLSIE